jgi:DNA repair protein RecO (recombination protein O)
MVSSNSVTAVFKGQSFQRTTVARRRVIRERPRGKVSGPRNGAREPLLLSRACQQMSSEKATAIVLKVVEFSETSSVLTLFSREFGKLRGLAKGARRPKGPFESALDLLALCRIVFLRKSSDALDLLTEAKLERRFRPYRGALSNLYAAYYVAELLNALTDDYDPHPELFDVADQTLLALRETDAVAPALVRFELTALRALGHLPSLESCAECGARVEAIGRIPFSQPAGGVLCKSCRHGQKQIILLSAAVLQALVRFSTRSPDALPGDAIEARTYGELRAVLKYYWSHLLGHPLKLHNYLS